MIRAEWFFWLVGAVFLAMAGQMLTDRTNPRRFGTAAFCTVPATGLEDAPSSPRRRLSAAATLAWICSDFGASAALMAQTSGNVGREKRGTTPQIR